MDLEFTSAHRIFREEVRSFLDVHLTQALRSAARSTTTVFAEPELGRVWQQVLHEKGWLAYHWPAKYGGTGWSPAERYIFEKECALAGAPVLAGMGLRMLGPVLHTFGTPEQQARYLPKILSGDHYWCQGFSEPGAGSDLASLKTRAVKQGDQYVVHGRKTWITHAQFADHMFCLARTNPSEKPQRGISFLLIDMNQRGVEVRPIIGLAGEHEINMVFLDDVVVHESDLVGEEGQGWTIAKFLLEHERGSTCYGPSLLADIARLRTQASTEPSGTGAPLERSCLWAAKLARLELEAQALETTELRILAQLTTGATPGPQASLIKLVASGLRQQINALAMATYGYAGLALCTTRPLDGEENPVDIVAPAYLNSRAWSIFGGTNEIQRTIIAKTILEL